MDPLADHLRGSVDQADDTKAVRVKPGVIGQGRAEVADANDDHWPVVGRTDDSADLEPQVLHVVADPASAVRTQIRQILAELGCVHARGLGKRTAADGVDLLICQLVERSKVNRKPSNSGIWNSLEGDHRSPMLTCRRPRRRVSRESL